MSHKPFVTDNFKVEKLPIEEELSSASSSSSSDDNMLPVIGLYFIISNKYKNK